jgi:hypothetical protein
LQAAPEYDRLARHNTCGRKQLLAANTFARRTINMALILIVP